MITRRELVIGCVVGVALRLLALGFVAHRIDDGDGAGYARMAINLSSHGVVSSDEAPPFHPTMERAPMLPLVAAALFRITGEKLWPVQLVHALATTAACLLLALAVARLAPDAARLTLWMALLSPFDIGFSGAMLAEPLCTTFLVVVFAAPILWPRAGWPIAGAALGAAALSRDIYLGLVPFVAVAVVAAAARRRKIRRGALCAAFVIVGALAVVTPWTVRNYYASGRVVPVSRGLLWLNLWIGTWERNGDWEMQRLAVRLPPEAYRDEAERRAVAEAFVLPDPIERDARFRTLTVERLRREPLAIARRWVTRAPRMWIGTRFDLFTFRPSFMAPHTRAWTAFKASMLALDVATLALAFLGVVLAARARASLLFFATPLAYQALVYFPFHNVETRFTQPVFPFIIVFAAFALRAAMTRFRRDEAG